MGRRLLCLVCSLLLAGGLVGCAPTKKQVTYLDVFDTVCTVTAYGARDEEFQQLHEELVRYHRLFDIYNTYEGLPNLKTVNDAAGQPVAVDGAIIDLLTFCQDVYTLTAGKVNVLLGSVLALWHDAREREVLPSAAALQAAAAHTDPAGLVIDRAAGTVQLTDPAARLDVGAVAKGFATQRVADFAREELGWTSALLDIGGNVCAIGGKGDASFVIGIQNPDQSSVLPYVQKVAVRDVSVVTSGDYQRYVELDGTRYHHIIDPTTLWPATYAHSVTVICRDSGWADALSTALFCLPQQMGAALLEQVEGAAALWVLADGSQVCSKGFEAYSSS